MSSDLAAGVTVGLVALPLAMAFAISSGVTPQAGLYCAIVTGFVISAFGGSKTQIGGPTGAFVVVVAGIIAKHGLDGLFVCTMMAGVLLVLLGVTGMGTAVKYFPRPVIVGFTNGIAILIASTQIKDFFGLRLDQVPGDFFHRMKALGGSFGTLNWQATLLAVISLVVMILCQKYARRVPGAILVCFGATAAVALIHLVWKRSERDLAESLKGCHILLIPQFQLRHRAATAFSGAYGGHARRDRVADVGRGFGQNEPRQTQSQRRTGRAGRCQHSVAAGWRIAGDRGHRADSDQRTRWRKNSGGRNDSRANTAGDHFICRAAGAKNVPLAALAAILMMVAYNMGDWEEIPEILKLSAADIAIWLVTLTLTVVTDLSFAVEFGMILAALTFHRKVSRTTTVTRVTRDYVADSRVHVLQGKDIPDYAVVYRVHGPFLFGATDKFADILEELDTLPPIVILRLRNMTAIDATGLGAIRELADRLHASGRQLLLCGAREQPAQLMKQAEFARHVGAQNICPSITAALVRAADLHDLQLEPSPKLMA